MFMPAILTPEPDPAFVRELRLIDPALRVVFGYQRYLIKEWAVERRLTATNYHIRYRSLIEEGHPRFVKQPIYDTDRPIHDKDGNIIGIEIIGYRNFDLAPEWEWLEFAPALDSRLLLSLRRQYAWNRNHPFSRHRYEEEQRKRDEAKVCDLDRKLADVIAESIDEAWHDHDLIVTTGMPVRQLPGTELD